MCYIDLIQISYRGPQSCWLEALNSNKKTDTKDVSFPSTPKLFLCIQWYIVAAKRRGKRIVFKLCHKVYLSLGLVNEYFACHRALNVPSTLE